MRPNLRPIMLCTAMIAAMLSAPVAHAAKPKGKGKPAATAPVPAPPADIRPWVMSKDTGSCVIEKTDARGGQMQITSRGRMLVSAPRFDDALFTNGAQVTLTRVWHTGVREPVEAMALTVPGGGAQNLPERQVYAMPIDALAFASANPGGFTLILERDGTRFFDFDGRDAGPAFASIGPCAQSTLVVKPAPTTPSTQ